MNTMVKGHDDLPLNSAGRNLSHYMELREHAHHHIIEKLTTAEVVVPLVIVLLTVFTLALQYYVLTMHGPVNLPTFVDIPLA